MFWNRKGGKTITGSHSVKNKGLKNHFANHQKNVQTHPEEMLNIQRR